MHEIKGSIMRQLLVISVMACVAGCLVPSLDDGAWAYCGYTTHLENNLKTRMPGYFEERNDCEKQITDYLQRRYGNFKRLEKDNGASSYVRWYESYNSEGEQVGHGICNKLVVEKDLITRDW